MLKEINKHYRDTNIVFYEKYHSYVVNGRKMKNSVTGYISSFFDKFDATIISEKLEKTSKVGSEYYGMKAEDILRKWEIERDAGTRMHKKIESYLNDIPFDLKHDDFGKFNEFVPLLKEWKLVPYRTEWCIYDEELSIGGTIDFIAKNNETGNYWIFDWKRSKSISWNAYGKKMGKSVCSDIEDCNGNMYKLQINMYKYILEKNYNLKIEKMYIVNLHPSLYQPDIILVEDMTDRIKKI